jgi:hypothetical protein
MTKRPAAEMFKTLVEMFQQHAAVIPGLKPYHAGKWMVEMTSGELYPSSLYLEWERAWTVSCTLSVTFDSEREREEKDGETVSVTYLTTPKFSVSWGSTGRTTAQAQASVVLYQQIINLAALLEAACSGTWIVSTKTRAELDAEQAEYEAARIAREEADRVAKANARATKADARRAIRQLENR